MNKILVTGASGFVGNYITHALKQAGFQVDAIYNSTSPYTPIEGVNYKQVDLTGSNLHSLSSHYQSIVHSAAVIPGVSNTNEFCYERNKMIDDNIISFATQKNIQNIVFISSIYVCNPSKCSSSKYLIGKLETEKKLKSLSVNASILRISSPYGIGQKNRNVLSIFIENVLKGKDLVYYGSGERTQDFIHGLDIGTSVINTLKEISVCADCTLNIASSKPISMRNLALLVKDIYSHTLSEIRASGKEDVEEAYRANFDIEEAKKKINWHPRISLREGISEWINDLVFNASGNYI